MVPSEKKKSTDPALHHLLVCIPGSFLGFFHFKDATTVASALYSSAATCWPLDSS